MRKTGFFLMIPVILFFVWGCGQWEGGLPENVVARINQEQVTLEEFDREFREQILEPGKEVTGKSLGDLKKAYLDQMVERKILVQEARRRGMTVSPEELNQAIAEIRKDYSEKEFGERVGSKGMTLEGWKVRLEEKLLAEKMIRNASHYRGKIDDKEALPYYEAHRSSFQLPQRVRVRQIVVADGEEAIQLLKRLKKGEKFEKVASEKSLGPEKVNGGDLGYFSPGERPPEFDTVFTMGVGTISEVIKSPYGYHIFKLEEKTEPRQVTFEEAKAGILQELGRKKGDVEYRKWLRGLREKSKVVINKKLLYS
ncbi:MAG: peptidyl-prolyl cis-trans isomerase [Deltaproteobacteria bacterium]